MKRVLRTDEEPTNETGRATERGSSRDLTDTAVIDEFEEHGGLYRVKYDTVQATPSFAVVTVVSHITGRDSVDLDPLYESIDGDALDTLCTADASSLTRLTFRYSGFEITVGTDGVIGVVTG
ncbi:HalOD1 output domain-containing protein [Halobaculum rubrum]|uniref:HalOD1 output domain-containing protein n=1 Tax=Halobaculum rubrum TaxID=2872158 RepID=UPI001CA3BEB0|nr:HalOD1 output domain-containing protein [Halobaculum rubrum]QZX99939.1 hypothetical protein K6T25_02190 [Halobaculum rubrum]